MQPLPALQRASGSMAAGPRAPAATPARLRHASASAAAETMQSSFATADVIRAAGYGLEEHTVTTTDGYILRMERIPKLGALGSSCTEWLRVREHSDCSNSLVRGASPSWMCRNCLRHCMSRCAATCKESMAHMDCTLPFGCRQFCMPLLTCSTGCVLASLHPQLHTVLYCALPGTAEVVQAPA